MAVDQISCECVKLCIRHGRLGVAHTVQHCVQQLVSCDMAYNIDCESLSSFHS